MAEGECEALSDAVDEHRGAASEVVLLEARAVCKRLTRKRKEKSQRARKAHNGAMQALPQLQALASSWRTFVHGALLQQRLFAVDSQCFHESCHATPCHAMPTGDAISHR
jgi:hypothetical protein